MAVAAAIACVVSTAVADLEDGVFTSEKWRVSMEAPTNWQPTDQTAYPNILLWMERRDPKGVMLLAAEQVDSDIDSTTYAKKTITKLEEMGFKTRPPQLHTTTGASLVDFENGDAFLRQAYITTNGFAYTLTLSAESNRIRGLHLRAFDSALRSLKPSRAKTKPPEETAEEN